MARYSGKFNRQFGKMEKGFSTALLDAGKTVNKGGIRLLDQACDTALKSLDWMWPRGANNGPYKSGYRGGSDEYPWYTGTLHDSVACGVFQGSVLKTARYMTPGANEDQDYQGMTVVGREVGESALLSAGNFGSGAMGRHVGGLVAMLVVGVPYAKYIDEAGFIGWNQNTPNTHIGYVKNLGEYFAGEVIGEAMMLPKIFVKTK